MTDAATGDSDLLEASLIALGDAYEGMAAELFDVYIAGHPQFSHAFMNPEAARERMTRETIEAMVGQAAGEWWVESTVVNFIDLHHNYDDFTPEDYSEWFTLVIQTMAARAGDDWPKGASAAWHRQAYALVEKIAEVGRNAEVPMRG